MEEVYVLDASALILGCIPPGKLLIPAMVASELRGNQKRRIEVGDIEILSPSQAHVALARQTAKNAGDLPVLSKADIELLAVALDEAGAGREPVIVSDDYAVQNVAVELGIKTTPVGKPGIKRNIRWKWYCESCGWVFKDDAGDEPCPRCGAVERRRRS